MNPNRLMPLLVVALFVAPSASGITVNTASAEDASRPLTATVSGDLTVTGDLTFELDGTFKANHQRIV